jgi:hypothetical protein
MSFACAPLDDEFSVSGFDADEDAQLRSAADEWCEKTGGDYCPTFDGGRNTITLVSELETDVVGQYERRKDVGHISVLDRSWQAEWLTSLRRTVLHELGHHRGFQGHLGPGNVMAANQADEPDHLTALDVACAD